jgi:hypothetical protein
MLAKGNGNPVENWNRLRDRVDSLRRAVKQGFQSTHTGDMLLILNAVGMVVATADKIFGREKVDAFLERYRLNNQQKTEDKKKEGE